MVVCLYGCLCTVWMPAALRSQKVLGNLEQEVSTVVRHHMSAWNQTQISSRPAKCSLLLNKFSSPWLTLTIIGKIHLSYCCCIPLLILEWNSSGSQYRPKTSSALGILHAFNASLRLLRLSVLWTRNSRIHCFSSVRQPLWNYVHTIFCRVI